MVEFERTIACTLPPDQVRPALEAAARPFGGSVVAPRGGGFRISAGTWLATNPNAALWSLRVTREGDALRVRAEPSVFPWTRAKMARIAEVRLRQFCDVLSGTLGGGAGRALQPHEIAPFAAPDGPAGACLAFAANAASGAAAILLVFAALSLASLQMLDRQYAELTGRAVVLGRSGHPALPSLAELTGLGVWSRLGAAALFAMPMAFFLGLTHALVHAIGEVWRPIARLAPWAAIFLLLLGLFAFVPVLPPWSAVPYALLVPILAQVGTTLVWGRRGEIARTGPPAGPPRTALRAAAAVLAIALLALLVPVLRGHREQLEATALFRDRYLLTSSPGRALARLYYRLTPYAAEPLKEVYVPEDERDAYERTVKTALVIGYDSTDVGHLRRAKFSLEWALPSVWSATWGGQADRVHALIRERRHDFYIVITPHESAVKELRASGLIDRTLYVGGLGPGDPGFPKDLAYISPSAKADEWSATIARICRDRYRMSALRDLSVTGWAAIFYLGVPFGLALVLGLLCVPAALLYRKAPLRAAHAVVLATLVIAVIGLVLALRGATVREIAGLSSGTAEALTAGLASPHADVRHEAAYRAYRALEEEKLPRARLVAPLSAAIADPDVRVRLWACGAAGLTGDPSVRPALLAALDDPELFVRYRAAEGLGLLEAEKTRGARPGDPAVVAALERMARTASWYEAMYAINALRRIDPQNW